MVTENSILEEIRRLYESGSSGTLSLAGNSGEHVSLFFREGMIEAASTSLRGRRLGDYLKEQGGLSSRDIESAHSNAVKHKVRLGEAVVGCKLLSQTELGLLVRRQAIELLTYVVTSGFQVDSFTAFLHSYYAPARITYPHILLELSRKEGGVFRSQSDEWLALNRDIDLSVFPWCPQELCVLGELMYPNTFEALLSQTRLQEWALKRVLAVLTRLKIVVVSKQEGEREALARQGNGAIQLSNFGFEHLIPTVPNAMLNEKIAVARDEFSFTSEQFKTLKVQIAESGASLKVLTVSSPDAQDGKSLTSANLAFSFAGDPERRVIVVDCDLRNPSLASYLGVTAEPGLLQYLSDGRSSPYCYVRRIDRLYFLTTGGVATNPIETLSMQKMRQLIELLRKDFDTIILDAPPYAPIADARIVTGLSDALILVVRRGKTSYSSTDRALKSIDRKKLLGVVFNDVQPMLFHTYQNFGQYYYSGKQLAAPGSGKPRTNDYLKA
jgi:capsular exopolysaccharide synthesis family protein